MFAYVRHELSYARPAKLSFICPAKHDTKYSCPRAEVSKPPSSPSSTTSAESLSLGINKASELTELFYQFRSKNHIRGI